MLRARLRKLLMLLCLFVYFLPSCCFERIATVIMARGRETKCAVCLTRQVKKKGIVCVKCRPEATEAQMKVHEVKAAEVSKRIRVGRS